MIFDGQELCMEVSSAFGAAAHLRQHEIGVINELTIILRVRPWANPLEK